MIKLKPIQITWELSFDAFAACMLFTNSSLILLTNLFWVIYSATLTYIHLLFNCFWCLTPSRLYHLKTCLGSWVQVCFIMLYGIRHRSVFVLNNVFYVLISHKNGKLSMQCSFWATKGTSHIEVIFAFVFKLDIFFLKLRKRKS